MHAVTMASSFVKKKNVTQSDTFGCKLWRVYKLKMTFLVLLSCMVTAYVIALLLDFYYQVYEVLFLYIINEASKLLQYVLVLMQLSVSYFYEPQSESHGRSSSVGHALN